MNPHRQSQSVLQLDMFDAPPPAPVIASCPAIPELSLVLIKIGQLQEWLTTPLGVIIERWYDLYDQFVTVFDDYIEQLKAQPRQGPYSQFVGQKLTLGRERRGDLHAFIYNAYAAVITQVHQHVLILLAARGQQDEDEYLADEVSDLFQHPDSNELCTPLGLLCQRLVEQYWTVT